MSYSIWGAIAETPWWIYLFFLAIFNTSYQSTKPHNVSMKSALIMPLIFTGMLIVSLAISATFDKHTFLLMLYALIPGIIAGWLQLRLRRVQAIKSQSQFHIPGSWSLLIILFALITAKIYFFGYGFNISMQTLTQNMPTIIVLSGFVIGLSIGRMIYLYRCMKYGPFLEEIK